MTPSNWGFCFTFWLITLFFISRISILQNKKIISYLGGSWNQHQVPHTRKESNKIVSNCSLSSIFMCLLNSLPRSPLIVGTPPTLPSPTEVGTLQRWKQLSWGETYVKVLELLLSHLYHLWWKLTRTLRNKCLLFNQKRKEIDK